ncbi:MAG: diguanylate cyclase [Vibrio sp.]
MQHKYPLLKIILLPLLVVCALTSVLWLNFLNNLNDDIDRQYDIINSNLSTSVKLLGTLQYSVSTYFYSDKFEITDEIEHTKEIDKYSLCKWLPIDDERTKALKKFKLNYIIKGTPDACSSSDRVYKDIQSKLHLAPSISLLNGIENYITGFAYISKYQYVLFSPAPMLKHFDKTALNQTLNRDYWKAARNGDKNIILTGPVISTSSHTRALIISAGIYHNNAFQGVVTLNLDIDKFLSNIGVNPNIHFMAKDNATLPKSAYFPMDINIDDVENNLKMYIDFPFKTKFELFLQQQATILIFIFILYVLSVIMLYYLSMKGKMSRLQYLSEHDPLTSLLNRRGFELHYRTSSFGDYEAIALVDIDNFKTINDTHGHDVGDRVVIHLSELLLNNMKPKGTIARFGGDEFVIHIQADTIDEIKNIVCSTHQNIIDTSRDVLTDGYTVSIGLVIAPSSQRRLMSELLADADAKLYQAKNAGRNHVAY